MKNNSPSRGMGIFLAAFVVIAVILGVLVLKKYETSQSKPQIPAPPTQAGTRLVALFFATPDGTGLIREGREIEPGSSLEETVEEVIDELISGPLGDYAPTLPPGTRVIGVRMQGDLADLDFSRELMDSLPAGSSAEMMAVYSIVDTLTVNFPEIKRVQFLIEGARVASLKGHLDLRTPVAPDYSLERK